MAQPRGLLQHKSVEQLRYSAQSAGTMSGVTSVDFSMGEVLVDVPHARPGAMSPGEMLLPPGGKTRDSKQGGVVNGHLGAPSAGSTLQTVSTLPTGVSTFQGGTVAPPGETRQSTHPAYSTESLSHQSITVSGNSEAVYQNIARSEPPEFRPVEEETSQNAHQPSENVVQNTDHTPRALDKKPSPHRSAPSPSPRGSLHSQGDNSEKQEDAYTWKSSPRSPVPRSSRGKRMMNNFCAEEF